MTWVLWIIFGGLVVSFGLIVLRGAPYVPSHRKQLINAFTRLYPVSSKDIVVDLGSGDGVVLQVAAQQGAKAVGYELNPFLVLVSKWRLRKYTQTLVIARDFLALDELPSGTTLVYAFTTSHNIEEIGKKMQQWADKKPLRFISYGFVLKDVSPVSSHGPMHLYLFEPAKA